jgi:hypothetical protein
MLGGEEFGLSRRVKIREANFISLFLLCGEDRKKQSKVNTGISSPR